MPDQVAQYVKSATYKRFGISARNRRLMRSGARFAFGSGTVVRRVLPRTAPEMPSSRIRRSTVHRAISMPSRPNCRQIFRAP